MEAAERRPGGREGGREESGESETVGKSGVERDRHSNSGALLIYGASGHGKVVADVAQAAGWRVIGFADGDPAKRGTRLLAFETRAIGPAEAASLSKLEKARFVVAIGDNRARKKIFDELLAAGLEPAAVAHPRACVAPSATVGPGTVVMAGAVINPEARIGSDVIINTGATIDHDDVIADHVHIGPGAHLGGTVQVGEGTHVGIGATVKNNVTLGAWSILGAGSVLVGPLEDGVVAYGVPARVARRVVS